MNGFLRIYNADDKATYEKPKNFYNHSWDILYNPCPVNTLLPFWFDGIAAGSVTVSEFKCREITLNSDGYTIANTYTLTTGDIAWDRGTLRDTFYYLGNIDQSTELTGATTGIYNYYIKLSDGSEWISEPFWYLASNQYSVTGDYDSRDYQPLDYYI